MRNKSLVLFIGLIVTSSQAICHSCDSIQVEFDHVRSQVKGKKPLEKRDLYSIFLGRIGDVECPMQLSSLHRNIAIQEFKLNELILAKATIFRSIQIARNVERKDYIASSQNVLGNIYQKLDQLDSALFYYDQALKNMKLSGKEYLNSILYQNLAHANLEMRQYSKAEYFTKLLKKQSELEDDKIGLCTALQLVQLIEMEQNGVQSTTILKLKECIQCFADVSDPNSILNLYQNIGLAHKKLGNLDSSLIYYETASNLADSINSSFDLAYLNVSTSNLSRAMQAKSKIQSYWVITLVVLAFAIGLIAIIALRNRQQKLIIQQQEMEALVNQREIEAMDAILTGQDRERKRIAEELHDRLGGLLAAIKISHERFDDHLIEIKDKVKKDHQQTVHLIDETVEEVRRISHDLHSGVLVKFGLKAALNELESIFNKVEKPKFHWVYGNLSRRPDSEIEINCYRIIQEALSNIIRHAEANEVTIQIMEHEEELTLIIEDDGKGFDVASVSKGVGLDNMKARVSRIKGQISIDSSLNKGTTISLQIPHP